MKFTVFNRNFIDGVEEVYDVVKGTPVAGQKNETLDSSTVVIPHLDHKIEIEPDDDVILKENNLNTKYLCVASVNRRQLSVKEPVFYQYTITLTSRAKHFENILLPSLKITQTFGNAEKKSVMFYIGKYFHTYGPQIRKQYSYDGRVEWAEKYYLSNRILKRFSKIDCPEMQWNQPTLREVLNDLMMVDDCILTINNFEVDYIDLTEIKEKIEDNPFKLNGINFVESSQSIEDYVSDLRLDLKNLMQSNVKGVDNTITVCDRKTLRSDDYLLSTENIMVETTLPILRIKKFKIGFVSEIKNPNGTFSFKYLEKDLMNLVDPGDRNIYRAIYEEDEFRTRKLLYNIPAGGLSSWKKITDYQNFCLHFKRGSNKITGFSKITSNMPGIGKDTLAIQYITRKISQDNHNPSSGETFSKPFDIQNDIRDIFIEIEYETTAGAVMSAGRYLPRRNHREVYDNQTNSYIDVYSQGILEYMKVNRLGNELLLINARYEKVEGQVLENIIPDLGDTYQGCIIFKKELSVYDDFINANYYATKDYVLRDYFTGVRAKIRSWKIVDGTEALTRHDLRKLYFEFSYNTKNELPFKDGIEWTNIIGSMVSPFYERTEPNYLKACFVRFKMPNTAKTAYLPDNTYYNFDANHRPQTIVPNYYFLDFSSRLAGNSILLTFKLNDNYNVEKYIDNLDKEEKIGGHGQRYYTYADDNGNNLGFEVIFSDTFDPTEGKYTWPSVGDYVLSGDASDTLLQKMKKTGAKLPRVEESAFINGWNFSQEIFLYKDNAEITAFTTQFEFCSDTEDIVFGKEFMRLQEIISKETNDPSIFNIYASKQKPSIQYPEGFNVNDPDNKLLNFANITVENVSETTFGINVENVNNIDLINRPYIYITNGSGKMIIAWNTRIKPLTTTKTIYLNLLQDRDCNIYDSSTKKIVGNIVE